MARISDGAFFFCVCANFTFFCWRHVEFVTGVYIKIRTMIEVSPEQLISQLYRHTFIQSAAAAALCYCCCCCSSSAAASCWSSSSCGEWPSWCWFIESHPSVFLPFIHKRIIFDVPLGSTNCVAFTVSICHILGNCGHARSQGRRQPATARPPLYK